MNPLLLAFALIPVPMMALVLPATAATAESDPTSAGVEVLTHRDLLGRNLPPGHFERGVTSLIMKYGNTVVKTPKAGRFRHFNLLEREVCVLKLLQRFPWAARLLGSTNTNITMTYMGSPFTKATLPGDYDSQLRKIIFDMKSVGVRHNDIMFPCSAKPGKHEVMVQNGRLSLIDFGWATIDGQVPCNVSKHMFVPRWKPCPDSRILEVLGNLSSTFTAYKNAHRPSGSQGEVPQYKIASDSTILVRGYQRYNLKNQQVTEILSYNVKFEWIRKTLMRVRDDINARSLMDIGCSGGLISHLAQEVGYTTVLSLDHDAEYIKMLNEIVVLEKLSPVIRPRTFSFGDAFPSKVDVVVMGALIHWVFTCTANFGRFDSIMDYLMTTGTRVLIIEWVDPEDSAIKSFHHDKCGSAPQEPYTESLFQRALLRMGTIEDRWALPNHATRIFYTVRFDARGNLTAAN